jgi:hypothetical protein
MAVKLRLRQTFAVVGTVARSQGPNGGGRR